MTKYQNGDPIPLITFNTMWNDKSTGVYFNYNDNDNNAVSYGRLYNWYAITDKRNIAPVGWHVPNDEEWKQLEMVLGTSRSEADNTGWRGTDRGDKLKETGCTHWIKPNTGATNESGFCALPGGIRWSMASFYNMGYSAFFLTSSTEDSHHPWYCLLDQGHSGVYRDCCPKDMFPFGPNFGLSVRLVSD